MKKSYKIIKLIIKAMVLVMSCFLFCFGCAENQKYYIGDTQDYKGLTFTVHNIKEIDYYVSELGTMVDAESGKTFIEVSMTVKNNSSEEFRVSLGEFYIIETENNAKIDALNSPIDDTILDKTLQPYEEITGVVRFYVTNVFAEKKPHQLLYSFTDYDAGLLWEEIELEWLLIEG